MPEPHAHRRVVRRDARTEGEPDIENAATEDELAMKETQRDLTSLSGPVRRGEDDDT